MKQQQPKMNVIELIKLDANRPFPEQLKEIRIANDVTLRTMATLLKRTDANVYHYETQNTENGPSNPFRSIKKNLTEIGLKYAKALGATKIEITL